MALEDRSGAIRKTFMAELKASPDSDSARQFRLMTGHDPRT